MRIRANDFDEKDIYKFIRQASGKTHKQFAKDIDKSKDWSQDNEIGRNNYKFKDLLELCRINNFDIIITDRKEDK